MSDKINAAISTLEARIAKDTAKLAELIAKRDGAALFANVGAGNVVTFKVGRAETRREVEATVLGRGEVNGHDSIRAVVGEGFEQEIFTVKVSDLLSVKAEFQESGSAAQATSNDDILREVLG